MGKKVTLVGDGPQAAVWARRLAGAEVSVVGRAQSADIPAGDIAVLLGDPEETGTHAELLRRNLSWVRAAAAGLGRRCPDCRLVVAARPVNALVVAALCAAGGLARHKVLGAAGAADAARAARLLAQALGVTEPEVRALAWGGCGEYLSILPRFCSVGGLPVEELLCREELDRIIARSRAGASADELAAAAAALAAAMLSGVRRVASCSVLLEGEYGVDGVALTVPAVLGPDGIERVLQLNLKVAERAALQKAAGAGRALLALSEGVLP
ncbi:MAG: hypothetical protein WC881_10470 [Elusimicrobiota bacterium]|jgi:malate dehydrogenase